MQCSSILQCRPLPSRPRPAHPFPALLHLVSEHRLLHSVAKLQPGLFAGERIFDWFTPAAMYKHKLPFTVCFTATMFIVFFYCAAEYPIFIQRFATFNRGAPAFPSDCYAKSNSTYYGPRQMEHWIKSGVSHCTVLSQYNVEHAPHWTPLLLFARFQHCTTRLCCCWTT